MIKREKGFTLIEVVIVLAIAALIMLVVFQAVASAQKSQRDNARKSEAARIVSYLEQFNANCGGKYPASATDIKSGVNCKGILNFDKTLVEKYTFVTGSYNSTGDVMTYTQCPTGAAANAIMFRIAYAPGPIQANKVRNYQMGVCTEQGGFASIKQ